MKRNTLTAITGAVLFLSTVLTAMPAQAQDMKMPAGQKMVMKPGKARSTVMYKAHCGMIYSAADAKKYHYICPMDHKPLVKITSSKTTAHAK